MAFADNLLHLGRERSRMLMIATYQVILFLMLGLATWLFAHELQRGLRTGKCRMNGRDIAREDRPIFYWVNIVMLIVWVVLLPCCIVYGEYMLIQVMRMGGPFPP